MYCTYAIHSTAVANLYIIIIIIIMYVVLIIIIIITNDMITRTESEK